MLIFAHLVEVHATPLEDGVVLAGHEVFHQAEGANLDVPDFLEELEGIMESKESPSPRPSPLGGEREGMPRRA